MHLEQEVDSASMDQLEELLTQAQACPNLKPNMATLAKSVVNLRHQTWGRSPPSPAQPQWSSADGASHQSNHFSVLILCDGQIKYLIIFSLFRMSLCTTVPMGKS
jgi:hypothetical protein